MSSLDDNLFIEVFLVAPDTMNCSSGPLFAFKALEELLDYLRGKSLTTSTDVRVLHGCLTPATVIPKNLERTQHFVVVKDPNNHNRGAIFDSEAEDFEELADRVEEILEREEIAHSFAGIEHIYILYGYELSVVMTVDEEEMDMNKVKACEKVAMIAKNLYVRRNPDE